MLSLAMSLDTQFRRKGARALKMIVGSFAMTPASTYNKSRLQLQAPNGTMSGP